jgi:hypothetical protein
MKPIFTCIFLFLSVFSFSQISEKYPNDKGIENDPEVLFVEKFDDGLKNILSRYDNIHNADGMILENDLPPGSSDGFSLKMTSIQGKNNGGHLYKNFTPGFDSVIFLRYYIKYPKSSKGYFHHEGVWFGGYNPATKFANPQAGRCGLGDKRISIAYEMMDSSRLYPYPHIGTYIYWGDMRNFPNNFCYGNLMQCGEYAPPAQALFDEWTCVEIMIKLNNPISEYNGELRTWINGVETGYWGPGFPNGSWTWGNFFINPNGEPFEGFRWRTDENLNINWIWLEFYHDDPRASDSYMQLDHIVMAKKYIGPIKNK